MLWCAVRHLAPILVRITNHFGRLVDTSSLIFLCIYNHMKDNSKLLAFISLLFCSLLNDDSQKGLNVMGVARRTAMLGDLVFTVYAKVGL